MSKKEYQKEIVTELKSAFDVEDDDDDLDASMAKLVRAKVLAAAAATIAAAESRRIADELAKVTESNTRLEQSGIDRIIAGQHAIAMSIAAIAPEDNKAELLELAKSFAGRDNQVNVTTIGQSTQHGDGANVGGESTVDKK